MWLHCSTGCFDCCEDWKQFGCECEKPTCQRRGYLLIKFVLGCVDASTRGMSRALCSYPTETLGWIFNAVLINCPSERSATAEMVRRWCGMENATCVTVIDSSGCPGQVTTPPCASSRSVIAGYSCTSFGNTLAVFWGSSWCAWNNLRLSPVLAGEQLLKWTTALVRLETGQCASHPPPVFPGRTRGMRISPSSGEGLRTGRAAGGLCLQQSADSWDAARSTWFSARSVRA